MRVLVFHGYLLRGTGSNVYNARLAPALAPRRRTASTCCARSRRPEELDFVDAVGTWEGGERARRDAARAGARDGVAARTSAACCPSTSPIATRASRRVRCSSAATRRSSAYVEANVAAVRDVRAAPRPDVALANHLVMGPAIVARGLGGDVPYAVKVHGSALEYVVKRDPERFLPWAREGLARARDGPRRLAPHRRVAVGGDGRRRPARAHAPRAAGRRRRRVPPARRRAEAAVAALIERLVGRRPTTAARAAFARDAGAAAAPWRTLDLGRATATCASSASSSSPRGSTCSRRRGRSCPTAARSARVVGFGGFRDGLERAARRARPRATATPSAAIARGRARARGRPASAAAPSAGLPRRTAPATTYWAAARDLRERVVLTGRLEHDELAPLLAACEALVVPEHLPRGLRDGRRRGGGVRRPAGLGRRTRAPKEVSAMLAAAVPGGGARLAVVPDRRRRGARHRRARARVAAGAGRRCAPHAGRARGHRPRALLVGGRRPAGVVAAAQGRAGGAAARGLSIECRARWVQCSPDPACGPRSRALAVAGAALALSACSAQPETDNADLIAGKQLFVAEVRLLPRARPRRHQGHHGPEPRPGLPAGAQGRHAALGLRRRHPRPDPAPQPQRRHAGQARHGRRRLRRRRLRGAVGRRRRQGHRPAGHRGQAGRRRQARRREGRHARRSTPTPTASSRSSTERRHGHARADHGQDANKSGTPHDIVIDGKGKGEIVQDGGVSQFQADFDGRRATRSTARCPATARPACRASSRSSSGRGLAPTYPLGVLKLPLVPSD